MEQTAAATVIGGLRESLGGRIVGPDDTEYEGMRGLLYADLALRPAAIVRVANAADIAAAVRAAARHGLEIAVRSGGHSLAGHSSTEGGVVIDLRDMKRLEIDAAARTAWAETGLTAAEVTSATAGHGLAIGFGDAGSVGIGGITLGGGIGFLTRKYGLTIDSLVAAEIVTADGSIVLADAEHHPDLFWAIRGGGGNFGVVTRLKFRLHPLKQIVGGMLMLPATPDTVAGFVTAAEAAPDELSTIANVMPAPPMPFVPAEVHGKLVIFGMVAYAGDAAAGERAVAPFRALAPPIADMVRPMQLPELYPPEDPNYHPAAVARTMFVDHVDRGVAETILDTLAASDASIRVTQLRVLGGAASRIPTDATAYAHRASKIMVNVAAFYDGLEDRPRREAWVRDFAASLRQGDGGAYSNFLADEGMERTRAAYPGKTWDRLAAVKRRYDPGNLFRRNQNIAPA
jgi:FAD/FMN-containing dehydrogenase